MPRIPVATYRLQLHSQFGFDAAASVADYLYELGVSHVYSSPYLQAAPGSTHGYDVVDHHRVNEELGGVEAHDRFCKRLGQFHLGQVLDIVPNHMAISGRRNRLWWDVLENGPSSRYAPFFDINWDTPELRNKILVPILGDRYGRVLAKGELKVARKAGDFFVQYAEHEYPIAPRSLPLILHAAARETGSDYLTFLADSLTRLPAATDTNPASKAERHRDKAVIGNLLERLFAETPFIAEAVDKVCRQMSDDVDRLDHLLEMQNFRLAFWQTAQQDLPYRRFFDVNTLVALRMEDPQVFAETHALLLRWLREGVLDGLRIDHPDGLRDPKQYFEELRSEAQDVWIVAEKILEPGEKLRSEWPVDGTTGYDFLNQAGGLFVDSRNEDRFNQIYADFTGEPTDYAAVCRDKKHRVLRDLLGSDVNRLVNLLGQVCELHRDQRDYTRHDVLRAVREVVACFPVYRTYVVPERDEITAEDERYTNKAIESAKAHRPEIDPSIFDFISDLLLLRVRGTLESEFVMRFQQFCSPAMAKGVEDTVFYCYNRLVSLNEVGGDPGKFGVSPEEFHRLCRDRQRTHPRSLLASSTHDTKRSEDVRARLNLLSEMPDEWSAALQRWSTANEKYKTSRCPDRNTEYLLYQTMVGAWPIGPDRLLPYMEKATREAKQKTSWLSPNAQFEKATQDFIEAICHDQGFVNEMEQFVQPLLQPGRINSLAQVLLKYTAPGIPGTYQGQELWDLSLVDPDNRRPVDYDLRRRMLAELPQLQVEDIQARMEEGFPKLWVTYHALRVRKELPAAFGEQGHYEALQATGAKAQHLLAYVRGGTVAILVPRLVWQHCGDWATSTVEIPSGTWSNALTGETLEGGESQVGEVLRDFPVALLVKQ